MILAINRKTEAVYRLKEPVEPYIDYAERPSIRAQYATLSSGKDYAGEPVRADVFRRGAFINANYVYLKPNGDPYEVPVAKLLFRRGDYISYAGREFRGLVSRVTADCYEGCHNVEVEDGSLVVKMGSVSPYKVTKVPERWEKA